MKRNREKRKLYKKIFTKCGNPQCSFGYGIEVHHIVPLSKDGIDDYCNYISLCAECHRTGGLKLHSRYKDKQIAMFTFKFYDELMTLGKTSDDLTSEGFKTILREYLKDCKKKSKKGG